MEEWKPILDYPNYEISNLGNVRSKKTTLKPLRQGHYYYVILWKGGFPKNKTIHRLVAETFIPNPDNKPEVDHIDRDIKNNCVSNLRWVTSSENCLNRQRNELFGIYYNKNTYQVQITRNRKVVFNHRFKTLEEAIKRRDEFISS